jgi:hypothetical protein
MTAGMLFPVMLDVRADQIPDLVAKAEELDSDMSKRFRSERTPVRRGESAFT